MTRRDIVKATAALPAILGSAGPPRSATAVGDEGGPATLKMDPVPRALKIEWFPDGRGGGRTAIVRSFDRPDLCHRCPDELCSHDGGFCLINARGLVPPKLCGDYRIGRPDDSKGGGRG